MSKDKVIQRVRQLLALAEHKDTPPEEKEAAFAKAGELMYRHEIEQAELKRAEGQEEKIILWEFWVSGKGGHGRERAWALGNVADGMGCETAYFGNDTGNKPRMVKVVGPESTIASLKLLIPAVELQLEAEAAKHARKVARELPDWFSSAEKAQQSARARRSFMAGFGKGILQRLTAARKDFAAELHDQAQAGDERGKSTELVMVNRGQMVGAEFIRLFPKLRKARKGKPYDRSSYYAGKDAGQRADLGDSRLSRGQRREISD